MARTADAHYKTQKPCLGNNIEIIGFLRKDGARMHCYQCIVHMKQCTFLGVYRSEGNSSARSCFVNCDIGLIIMEKSLPVEREMKQFKIIVEKHPDTYVAYPLGIKGVVVGQGDTYEAAIEDVTSALKFHMETFGIDDLDADPPILEAFIAETRIAV